MSTWISANRFLTESEMEVNARFIFGYLRPRGWSAQAICGMLGNMETESTINPGIWENLDSSDPSRGFGLVQWTPSTKYRDWCSANELDPTSMISALKRIEYEVENEIQWIPSEAFPNMTFQEFKTSTISAGGLATRFLYNYERPAVTPQPDRSTQAEKWFSLLASGDVPDIEPDTPSKKSKKMDLILLLTATRRRF